MSGSEIALILGATAALITALGGVVINAHRLDEITKQLAEAQRVQEKLRQELTEAKRSAQAQNDIARTNIVLLGESMGNVRSDNAKMALLINQLFNQFEQATGHKPDVDISMIKHLRTLEYITGPLGPIDVPEQFR